MTEDEKIMEFYAIKEIPADITASVDVFIVAAAGVRQMIEPPISDLYRMLGYLWEARVALDDVNAKVLTAIHSRIKESLNDNETV